MDPKGESSTAGQCGNTNKSGDKRDKKSVKLKKEKNKFSGVNKIFF